MKTTPQLVGKPEPTPIFWEDFDVPRFWRASAAEIKSRSYDKHVGALDIETSNNGKIAWMYLWCFAVDDTVVYGRTADDLRGWLHKLTAGLGLLLDYKLVVYIHNAKYDLEFLRPYFDLGGRRDRPDFIARTRHQIIKCVMDYQYEIRDSAVYSEMPLWMMGEEIGLPKLEDDYNEICTPETPLPERKLQYCARDVRILTNYYRDQILKYGSIGKVPLTATGTVRNQISFCFGIACKHAPSLRNMIWAQQLKTVRRTKKELNEYQLKRMERDKIVLDMLRTAFFGGYCYAADNWRGVRIDENARGENGVISADMDACYATQIMCKKFPVGQFEPTEPPKTADEEMQMRRGLGKWRGRAILIHCKIWGLDARLPDFGVFPSWLRYNLGSQGVRRKTDSARILHADYLEIIITELDYKQLRRWYSAERVEIAHTLIAPYGFLPEYIRDTVVMLYARKRAAKAEIKKKREDGTVTLADEIRYRRVKTMLARLYGVFVQDPIRLEFGWDDQAHTVRSLGRKESETNQFGPVLYQWGVWVAAHARSDLLRMCARIGTDEGGHWDGTLLYCDTDCVRWLNIDKRKYDIIAAENARMQNACLLSPEYCRRFYADYGIRIAPDILQGMGTWDIDRYAAYKQLGIKKYAYIDGHGKFTATVAGLPKPDRRTREDGTTENKGMNFFDQFGTEEEKLDAFTDTLIIPAENTRIMRTHYMAQPGAADVVDAAGVERHVESKSGIILTPQPYKMHDDDEITELDLDAAAVELAKAGIDITASELFGLI